MLSKYCHKLLRFYQNGKILGNLVTLVSKERLFDRRIQYRCGRPQITVNKNDIESGQWSNDRWPIQTNRNELHITMRCVVLRSRPMRSTRDHWLFFFKKNGPFPASFLYFRLFYKQLTVNKCSIKVANDWIRTRVLSYCKRPLCQLRHNHFPNHWLLKPHRHPNGFYWGHPHPSQQHSVDKLINNLRS